MIRAQEIAMPGTGNSENEIFADAHSLFIEDKPVTMEPLRDEEGNIMEGLFEQTGGYTIYKLFLGEFLESGNGMHRIISRLQNSNPGDILEFHISSRGGVIDELLELYNLCNTLFHGNVTTYCNHGYSAGAMAFLFGAERGIYEHSDWMMHSWSGGFGGKRDDVLTHMKHEDKRLAKFFNNIMLPYFTKKELKDMQGGKDFWMDSTEMLKRGIATHILKNGEVHTAEEYLAAGKKPKKSKTKTKVTKKYKSKKDKK